MARLRKSATNRMLFGVAGGLAEYFRIDPAIVRALFILASFMSGAGVLIYLALALLMPRPESLAERPLEVVKDNLRTAPRETTEAARRAVHVLRGPGAAGTMTVTTPPAEPRSEGTTVEETPVR